MKSSDSVPEANFGSLCAPDTYSSGCAESGCAGSGDFARIMVAGDIVQRPRKINLDHTKTKDGLAQLVLTVVRLLHELLEKQALRRIDAGSLTEAEIERLGFTLMRQSEELSRIAREFGLEDEDLNLDLGPLGKLL